MNLRRILPFRGIHRPGTPPSRSNLCLPRSFRLRCSHPPLTSPSYRYRSFSFLRSLLGDKIHNLIFSSTSSIDSPSTDSDPSQELEKKAKAHAILANAKKSLVFSSTNVLKSDGIEDWKEEDLINLTDKQLLEYAQHHYQSGDPEGQILAVKAWKLAGERGNKEALYSYGACLRSGIGVQKDQKKALEVLLTLAESNNAFAHVLSSLVPHHVAYSTPVALCLNMEKVHL